VKWSAELVAEVPPGVVAATSTVPASPAGEVAVTLVSLTTVTPVATALPKLTVTGAMNPVPVMVTDVPPASGPALGRTAVTVGTAAYVKWSAELVAEVPPGVVTVTSTMLAAPAGEVALMLVSLATVNEVAASVPKSTAVAPVNPVPVIVTTVPPAIGPALGRTVVTVGTAA
jgi:hypothetical protein